jgi:NTP pyrophosphatase (non-canonical NTP hydrolase)
MGAIDDAQRAVGTTARTKGFWEAHATLSDFHQQAYAKLALIHTEVAEATEALRDLPRQPGLRDFMFTDENGKPDGLGYELCDVVIRVLDMCEWMNVSMEYMLTQKMAYNTRRDALHGRQS